MTNDELLALKSEVLRRFEYQDGNLIYKISPNNRTKAGTIAGCSDNKGYLLVGMNFKTYKVHRLIFLMHHGYLPEHIDHINGVPNDNRIENLRAATMPENMRNKALQRNNTSGCKGVVFNKNNKKWMVNLRLNKLRYFLGYYEDKELADLVASSFREKYHGDFCNHGVFSHV